MMYYAAILFCLFLAGCGLMNPQQQAEALQVLEQMREQQSITQAQFEALREMVLSDGANAWWQEIGQIVLGAALGYVGVEIRRGKPTQRVGLPSSMVKP